MAQRSALAKSKLKKISQTSGPQFPPQGSSISAPPSTVGVAASTQPNPFAAYHNTSKSTSFNPATGLLTPSASSIATGSSGYSSTQHAHPGGGAGGGRHGFPFYNKSGTSARKSALRAIFEGQSEKIRGRLEDALRNKKSNSAANTNNSYTLGSGSKKLGDIREEKLLSVKRWDGGGKPGVTGWDKLQKDAELWLSDGDTLVYLSPQGHPAHQYSRPSFRIKSSVLKETGSQYFNAILVDKNLAIAQHQSQAPPRTQPPPHGNRPLTPSSLPGSPMSMTFDALDQLDRISSLAESNAGSVVSRTTSISSEGIRYEIHFPAPVGLNKEQTQKYHLTTRNVFALLFGKGLVGVTLGETLLDLVERMDSYIPPTQSRLQSQPSSTTLEGARKRKNRSLDMDGKSGNVARVLEYLLNREFDDVRNCPDVAAGVLVFAEKFQLGELWREAFCHCVGMLNQMEGGKEYMEISPITKALIDRASLEIQVRTGYADSRLATFQYEDVWPTSSYSFSPSKLAFERFQKLLIKHYQSRFGSWPPQQQKDSSAGSGWGFGLGGGSGTTGTFSRQIYLQLQRDFAALYDYLVDKDVSWEYPLTGGSSPTASVGAGVSTSTLGSSHPRNKPKMVSPNKKHFRADDDNLPLTDILIGFDTGNGFPHIPHPYPLVPELRARQAANGGMQNMVHQHSKHGFLAKRNAGISTAMSSSAVAAMDKAAALALTESTNIHSLLSQTAGNELVDAFAKHEKERTNGEFTPAEGRKGRWILIYGVLQTLASVAGDAPGLKYTEGVEYLLCSKLKGTPPWVSGGAPAEEGPGGIDDYHTRSHCWTIMGSWDGRRDSWGIRDNEAHLQLSPVTSTNSTTHTSSDIYSRSHTASRSIGVGAGDTTDTEAGYHHNRILGGRKRKAVPRTLHYENQGERVRSGRGRGECMSGDEGDDEADEEDEDVVMGEAREIPLLEREPEEGN